MSMNGFASFRSRRRELRNRTRFQPSRSCQLCVSETDSLLEKVDKLKESLKVVGDVGYTCETALDFFTYHVKDRWKTVLENASKM